MHEQPFNTKTTDLPKQRYAISSSSGTAHRLYWQGNCWSANTPMTFATAEVADREVQRLRTSRPHDATIQRVDMFKLQAVSDIWNATMNESLHANGYSMIPMSERQTAYARSLRIAAIALADQSVRNAGFAGFQGWLPWEMRPAADSSDDSVSSYDLP